MTDDERLAARLAADLEGCFPDVVQAFQDRLYGFALRMTGSPQDAEESTQDAFVRAYRALERYPTEQRRTLQLKAWLYRITLNVVRNRVRRPSFMTVPVDGAVTDWLADSAAEQPESVVVAKETQRQLACLITQLPPRYQTAVLLRHVQGLSYAEAADVLEQPVGTTKSDVHRGLRLLREALERQQVQPEMLAGRR
jgi:RNA polymerase sigma-70 factor (ECF subfamily)